MNLLFALPGFHRFDRGAEVALLAVASELARSGDTVTVAGSGPPRDGAPYLFRRIPSIRRERFEHAPMFPPLRSETAWEDATFALGLASKISLSPFDATVTCAFPFTHWSLRRHGRSGPPHIFVTQNGDWPATSNKSEFRFFRCDGLVCTNPDYQARNAQRWNCSLIPNGVDLEKFRPGGSPRERFGLPAGRQIILMVSAMIESKRVLEGIRAVATMENAHLVIAGDGPLRQQARELAGSLLPGRFSQLTMSADDMPSLYRAADVFLHMSLSESFGNVFLEAWASGLPIVAHESDRLRWILGDDQLLCDTQSPAQLAASLQGALNRGKSADVRGIERFAWPVIAAQYRAAIRHVVNARVSSRAA